MKMSTILWAFLSWLVDNIFAVVVVGVLVYYGYTLKGLPDDSPVRVLWGCVFMLAVAGYKRH